MKKRCIIHYKGLSNYTKLKELSERNKERILEAKVEREKLGGEHYHKLQCDGIPKSFALQDCIHLEPCYKKFTLILAGQSSAESNDNRRSSTRQSIGEILGLIQMFAIYVRGGAYNSRARKLLQ